MKNHLIIFILSLIAFNAKSQSSFLSGMLNISKVASHSIKVVLYNSNFNDTVFVDTTFQYYFKNVPYGVYCIKVEAAHEKTGYENLLVTDVLIDSSNMTVYPINLSKSKTCGCGSFVLGKKDTIEYYKTGEIYGKGHYRVSKKYYPKYKSVKYSYRKQGVWNYYSKSGKLLRKSVYNGDYLISFIDYYENGNKKMIGYYDDCKSKVWEYYLDNEDIVFIVDFSLKFTTKISYKYLKGYMDNFEMMEDL